jgi:outer membrane protein insertion porin family
LKTTRGHRLRGNLWGLRAFGLRPALFLSLLFAFGLTGIVPAQEEAATAVAPVVGDIGIEFIDLKTVSREAILSRIQIRPGMEYDQQLVDRSIRTLYGMRLFDFIEARTEEMSNNQVRVVFSVQSKYRIEDIIIKGAKNITRSRLFRDMKMRVGGVLDDRFLARDADTMLELYREKGYTQATVDYSIERNPETGRGIVTFTIDEGTRLKIAKIEFVGNTAFSNGKLRRTMKTKKRWFMSWLIGGGRFDEVEFQEDLEQLRTLYLDEGYLDVSIPESNVTLEYPSKGKILITVRIDEGRRYSVGKVTFEGNELFTSMELYPFLTLLPGDAFSPTKLDEDVERIGDLYGTLGYLDTGVRPDRQANIETGDIDLVYRINEGDRFDVESIIIEGNSKTKSTVIIRELALAPGRNFNLVYMKNSEARLKNTRFFENVQLSPEPTDIPGRRNLKIRVEEGRTGNLQFGAGFSSLESVVVFFEISQSNFDFFKWRSPFLQGDGQKFRLRGSIGSRSNEVVLYFEEPWLFEQRLAGGFEIYRRESDFSSAIYDELRTGVNLFLRKRLIGIIDGQLSYTLESTNLDYGPETPGNQQRLPPVIRGLVIDANPRLTSKLNLTLARDTRNDLIFTSRGSRYTLSSTWAGLGGDTEYLKFETRNAIFLPVFEAGDQVLQIIARAGTFWSYAETDELLGNEGEGFRGQVPFYDRYFLGGPNSLRGYEFREVSPRSGAINEPIGGNSYGFASAEYTIKIGETLRLAMFYDWGFVNQDDFDFSPIDYNDNWGFGIRLLVLGNPLRLDYGIPLTSGSFNYDGDEPRPVDNDEGGQFNFSFGTRF